MPAFCARVILLFLMVGAPLPAAAADLAEIQRALARVGCYDGPVDGKASLALRTAIRCFQRDGLGAAPDGTLSPEEERALLEAAASGAGVERGERYEPTLPRAAELPPTPTPAPIDLSALRGASAALRRLRESGAEDLHLGPLTCIRDKVEYAVHGVGPCYAYLAETAPADYTIFCARDFSLEPHASTPARCRALPPSLCTALGGRATGVFRECLRPGDSGAFEDTNVRLLSPVNFMHAAVVAAADWVEGRGGSGGQIDTRPELVLALQRVGEELFYQSAPEGYFISHVLEDIEEEKLVEHLEKVEHWHRMLALDLNIYCEGSAGHEQYSEILSGTISSGDREVIGGFCRAAAYCAQRSFLFASITNVHQSYVDRFRAAAPLLSSRLCRYSGPEGGYASLSGGPAAREDLLRQLDRAGELFDLLLEGPQDLPRDRLIALHLQAQDASGEDVFEIDPELERGVIYGILVGELGISIEDVASAVEAARSP